MIPAMSRMVTILSQIYKILGRLLGLLLSLSLFRLAPSIGSLLLRLVMRVRLFVVLAATTAEEKENFLSVPGTHIASLRKMRAHVKRGDRYA
jgi:hypothetical protein